eukprot:scaffold35605_cov41-Cyclotella_meneghiniana.AAC.4
MEVRMGRNYKTILMKMEVAMVDATEDQEVDGEITRPKSEKYITYRSSHNNPLSGALRAAL